MKDHRKNAFRLLAGLCTAIVATAVVVTSKPAPAQTGADNQNSRIIRGFQIAPVPLNLGGRSAASVGLGSYLVNSVGGCYWCHTQPANLDGGDPFLGQRELVNTARYMAGGREFGPFISRNLTPNAQGLPAGLTQSQFLAVLRTGVDLKNRHPALSPLLQVMPWPEAGKMTEQDLNAIYEYLQSIPRLPSTPPTPGL